METIVIDPRYNGPPSSGQGGFVAGTLAAFVEAGTVRVTLRSPPPLGVPLGVRRADDGRIVVLRDDEVIAEAEPTDTEIEIPAPVSFDEAVRASASYLGLGLHAYPTCFACGPAREEGDGLRIFAGLVADRGVAAAPWTPSPTVAGEDGTVDQRVMWAALDCPSFWGNCAVTGEVDNVLLGRLEARIARAAVVGERCVAVGWPQGRDGRKIYAGAALFGEGGELLGASRATWIALRS